MSVGSSGSVGRLVSTLLVCVVVLPAIGAVSGDDSVVGLPEAIPADSENQGTLERPIVPFKPQPAPRNNSIPSARPPAEVPPSYSPGKARLSSTERFAEAGVTIYGPRDVAYLRVDDEHVYRTPYGRFRFRETVPFVVTLQGNDLGTRVVASAFLVRTTTYLRPVSPQVVWANWTVFTASYGAYLGTTRQGTLTTTVTFSNSTAPKLTAAFAPVEQNLRFQIVWITLTKDMYVTEDGSTGRPFKDAQPFPLNPPDARVRVGPDADASRWGFRLRIDWSDEPMGVAYAGKFSTGGALDGSAVLVEFPLRQRTVDPTLADEAVSASATAMSIQRKTFAYGGFYWAFFALGAPTNDVAYTTSRDGITWSPVHTTGLGVVGASSFDVEVEATRGRVFVGYHSGTNMKVARGTIYMDWISWETPVDLGGIHPTTPPSPVDVWPAPDGAVYAARLWKDGDWGYVVVRSSDPDALALSFPDGPNDDRYTFEFQLPYQDGMMENRYSTAIAMAGWADGRVLVVASPYRNPTFPNDPNEEAPLYRFLRDPSIGGGGWFGYCDVYGPGLLNIADKSSQMSLIAHPDGTAYLMYYGKGDQGVQGIWRSRILGCDLVGLAGYAEADGTAYVTASLDANDDVHLFWLLQESPCGGTGTVRSRIRYARSSATDLQRSWVVYPDPIAPLCSQLQSWIQLTAAPAVQGKVFLLWTEAGSSSAVKFASLPTPMSVGSSTGTPWDRSGVSPFQDYFSQMSEFVSPGSGLLTVAQVDLNVPGRGIDLSLGRVFTMPRAFRLDNPLPWVFEGPVGLPLMGLGWNLSLPWIGNDFVYIPPGQLYLVRWDGNSYENHEGEPFRLRSWDNGLTSLYLRDGLNYTFGSNRYLLSITDATGAVSTVGAGGRNGVWDG